MSTHFRLILALLAGLGLVALMLMILPGAQAQPGQPETDIVVNTLQEETNSLPLEEPDNLPVGIWLSETVDSAGDVGSYTSLELDSGGFPHISYYDWTNRDLKYAYQDAAGWHIETVDSAGDVGKYTSLELDQAGYPHVSYYDITNGDLKYAYMDANGWHNEVADSQGGIWTSLALDSLGNPHISYRHDLEMVYSLRGDAGWSNEIIDSNGSWGCGTEGTSLAIDDDNYPHISYQYCDEICVPYPPWGCIYYSYADLRYAYFDGSGWLISYIDTSPVPLEFHGIGYHSSLRLDNNGDIHISYAYDANLKYYSPNTMEIIDDGDVGQYSSLALDASNRPYISYYDYAYGNLKFAYHDASGWHIQNLDSTGDVGQYTSQELDADGNPVISYYDATKGDLKVVRYFTNSVLLLPFLQSESGAKGETVSYQLTLHNQTGATDSFSLELGPHSWDVQVTPNPVGPIPDGNSATVTVSVTVPVDAPWYQTESLDILARSINDPSLVSPSTRLVTTAYVQPQINVAPQALSSTLYLDEITTQTLTISNGLGVTLTYNFVDNIPGEVLLLHLDEPAGSSNFVDSSGNGYNGFCSSSTCPLAGVPGKHGYALDFDGSDDFVQTTSFPLGGPISISAWVYTHNVHAHFARIIDFFDGEGLYNIVLCWYGDSGGMDLIVFNEDNWREIITEQVFPENAWVHVVAVIDDDGIGYIYWNGVLVKSGLMEIPIETSRIYHYIGRSAWGYDSYYNGLIDELTVFDRALTLQEIQALYLGNEGWADWLSVQPISGTVPTNNSIPIDVTFNAADLQPNVYTTSMTIESDDPLNSLVQVPVTMTVLYGIMLEPEIQTESGLPDSVVTYTIDLYNYTSLTDTYALAFGGNEWQTSLSDDLIGPLVPGSSQSITVSVTIPPDAGWYLTDTVAVTATSITSPTDFIASAQVTTQVYAPPQISVTPETLNDTQNMDEVTTRTLTISNGNGVTLTYETISSSPWLTVDPVSGVVPTNDSVSIQVTLDSTGLQPSVYSANLLIYSNDPIAPQMQVPVTMTVVPVAPISVILSGPDVGLAGHPYTFSAAVVPISATLPIQYAWQATGQPPITHTAGLSDTVAYIWDSPGTQVIIVTAANFGGTVTDTYTITITDAPISGLVAANDSPTMLGVPTTLSATLEAGSNVFYAWEFGDDAMGSGAVVTHTYLASGVYTATVTASNSAGQVNASTQVMVVEPEQRIYLPLISRELTGAVEAETGSRARPLRNQAAGILLVGGGAYAGWFIKRKVCA